MTDGELRELVKQEYKNFRRAAKGNFLRYGTIAGIKIGTAEASMKPPYDTYALNKFDTGTAVEAKASGKQDKVFVVQVIQNGGEEIVTDVIDAEKVYARWKDVTPRPGKLGEFWAARTFNDEEEPF